jgi:ABC-type sugar transport system substrate-binding protein
MDDAPFMTERSAVFAMALVGIASAWFFYQSSKKTKLHVIVYHDEDDRFFESFRNGVVQACHDRDVLLDYLSTSMRQAASSVFVKEIRDSTASAFLCRIPDAAVEAALMQSGRPFVSVLSDFQNPSGHYAKIDTDAYRLGETDWLVVDAEDDHPVRALATGNVLRVSAAEMLDALADNAKNAKVERIFLGSESLSHLAHNLAGHARSAFGTREVVYLDPGAYEKGMAAAHRLIDAVDRKSFFA